LRAGASAITPVGPDQIAAVDLELEGRVQMLVLERQHVVDQAPGRRSNLLVALEEGPFDLAAPGRDLESERNLSAAGDDDGVPETVDGRGRIQGSSGEEQQAGREQRGRQVLHR
jgi:hypothetical protein